MELLPIVEIVQVHGIGADGRLVVHSGSGEDALAGFVVVDVAEDGNIQLVDVLLVDLGTGLSADPFFEGNIGRLVILDESLGGFVVDTEGVEHHGIIAGTDSRIAIGELAGGFEGNFLPQARQVQDSERTGNTGTDHGDVFIAHIGIFCEFARRSISTPELERNDFGEELS